MFRNSRLEILLAGRARLYWLHAWYAGVARLVPPGNTPRREIQGD
jgi:hypothetical protein